MFTITETKVAVHRDSTQRPPLKLVPPQLGRITSNPLMAKTGREKRDKKHRICKKRGLREEGERGEANNNVGRDHLREGEG